MYVLRSNTCCTKRIVPRSAVLTKQQQQQQQHVIWCDKSTRQLWADVVRFDLLHLPLRVSRFTSTTAARPSSARACNLFLPSTFTVAGPRWMNAGGPTSRPSSRKRCNTRGPRGLSCRCCRFVCPGASFFFIIRMLYTVSFSCHSIHPLLVPRQKRVCPVFYSR